MTTSSHRFLGLALSAMALVGTAAISTDALADGRRGGGPGFSGVARGGPAFHGPRVGPGFHGGRPGGYYGPRGGGYWRGGYGYGYGWGGLALGLGIGALIVSQPWDPVIVERPTYIYADPPAPPPQAPMVGTPVPSRAAVAEPIVYPSKGQSVQQTEADRQDCNRWATTQPSAMADASVFHRATMACLEGRGYTVR